MGYIWDEKKTSELFNEAGYVLSGDLGRFNDGFLFVSGRQKEIIVTAGGENIAPVPIEDAIKELLKDYIANCLVIGDKRKHLAAILTLRTVLDDKNQPMHFILTSKSGLKVLVLKLKQLKSLLQKTIPRSNLRLWMVSRRSTREQFQMLQRFTSL